MKAMPSNPAASAAWARSTMDSIVIRSWGRKRWNSTASALLVGDTGGIGVPGRWSHTLGPQLALQHAAHRAARELGPELDVPGQGEVRELVDAPAEQLLLSERRPFLHRRRHLEIVLGELAGHGMHGHVGQRSVADEDALDLEAGDVLAPPAQVVGLAVDEVEKALVVDAPDVARVVPPVAAGLDRRLGPAPVALEHHVRALGSHHDFAVAAPGQLVVVVVEDAGVEVLIVDDTSGV